MKKIIALLIVFIMICSLFACSKDDTKGTTAPDVSQGSANGGDEMVDHSASANVFGFFSDGVEPSSRKTYDVVWAYMRPQPTMQNIHDAMVEMAPVLNINIIDYCANNDIDAMIQNIEVFADQGVDGFAILIDTTASLRIKEVLDGTGVPYVGILNPVRDSNGSNLVPVVGLDSYKGGSIMMQWLCEHYKDYWGEVDPAKIGLLGFTVSTHPDFNTRYLGALDKFNELMPVNAGVFEADGSVGRLDDQTGYDLAAATFAAHPEVEYWLVAGVFENYAAATARVVEANHMEDRVLIADVAGDILPAAWDSGYEGCWAACVSIPSLEYAIPSLCGLVSLINGTTTPDLLWSSIRNPNDVRTFFSMELTLLTKDTYKEHFARVRREAGLG